MLPPLGLCGVMRVFLCFGLSSFSGDHPGCLVGRDCRRHVGGRAGGRREPEQAVEAAAWFISVLGFGLVR